MRKIKEVRLKKEMNRGIYAVPVGYVLKYIDFDCKYIIEHNGYIDSFSESDILANSDGKGTDTFQVKFEDESFGVKVPDIKILRQGYFITIDGEVVGIYEVFTHELIIDIYLLGNWFATKQEAEAEAKRRKIRFALNKLRNEANEKYPTEDDSSHIFVLYKKLYLNRYYIGGDTKSIFSFNNYDAFDYFRTKLNQSPELKAGLIELLERGEL